MAHTVRDLMTSNPASIAMSGTIADAARLMQQEDAGAILVTKDDGSLCGIVTDRDIAVRAVAEGLDPSTTSVDQICTADLQVIAPDDDAGEAVRMMTDNAIRRLPVCEGDQPIGILSLGDLAIELDDTSGLAEISAAAPNN